MQILFQVYIIYVKKVRGGLCAQKKKKCKRKQCKRKSMKKKTHRRRRKVKGRRVESRITSKCCFVRLLTIKFPFYLWFTAACCFLVLSPREKRMGMQSELKERKTKNKKQKMKKERTKEAVTVVSCIADYPTLFLGKVLYDELLLCL